jgi:hypothetical protein
MMVNMIMMIMMILSWIQVLIYPTERIQIVSRLIVIGDLSAGFWRGPSIYLDLWLYIY